MRKIAIWETMSEIGGGQKITLEIIDCLSKTFDIFCILPCEGLFTEILKKKQIKYYLVEGVSINIGRKSLKSIRNYISRAGGLINKVKQIINSESADLLYVPGPSMMPFGALTGQAAGVKVVWHIHHMFQDRKALILLNLTSKLHSVCRIIAVTGEAGRQIKAQNKVVVVYNSIALEQFQKITDVTIREQYGLKKDEFVLIQIGFIQKEKNQLSAVEILHRLKNKGYHFKLLIVGEARKETMDYKVKLLKQIEKYKMNNDVIITGYQKEINNYIYAADLVMVMNEEGFSLAALEGMALGKPIVAINKGGVSEIVTSSQAGLLAGEGHNYLEEFQTAIERLFVERELYEYCRQNGIDFAKKNTRQEFDRKILELFQKV